MKKIALISDNHSWYGEEMLPHLSGIDEIWHAGDIGDLTSVQKFREMAVFRAVYGNIDDQSVKYLYGLNEIFFCEGLKIFMTHIGGYPGKYTARVSSIIKSEKPNIYICGHSHICKVVPDKTNNLLHMNPGAYGHYGFHVVRTILTFEIHWDKIQNLNVIELGLRGR
ncbi:MAG: metallophosphoesterase family protein [Saprospiraceae bacterium]|nr:metallophosphoesterase family protein [Saprospiraceae bacterium]MBK6566505.1 metallophosphoesterase family protein [Saprospiraceae bacterium]MBK7524445.1 metallophosphoesterase family protein [Saprospiraceae bacterium]MBK8080964.1 metallophosphoesterase family protein [Saprospiraceae bacterium]MBK8820192.1 metallophosphoesterase family protein [Saprospiraceae bacterium]